MIIRRYDDSKAQAAHNGTIRAHEVLPSHDGFNPPCESAWGYLNGPGELEPHAHPTDEVYMIYKGEGIVMVDGEYEKVGPGDIVEIPANLIHNIKNEAQGELLWAAFWWAHR